MWTNEEHGFVSALSCSLSPLHWRKYRASIDGRIWGSRTRQSIKSLIIAVSYVQPTQFNVLEIWCRKCEQFYVNSTFRLRKFNVVNCIDMNRLPCPNWIIYGRVVLMSVLIQLRSWYAQSSDEYEKRRIELHGRNWHVWHLFLHWWTGCFWCWSIDSWLTLAP